MPGRDPAGGPREGERLRVAVVAPPWFEIPPKAYGGIESVCHALAEGLVERGHDVVVVGAGEARTTARFVGIFEQPPDTLGRAGEALAEILHAARVLETLENLDVDVVHDHCFAGPLTAPGRRPPTVVTAHAPSTGDTGEYYRAVSSLVELVAISDAQRRLAPHVRWAGMVHNAVDVGAYPFRPDRAEKALFLGRLTPDKGPVAAIEAARAARVPLVLAGRCSEKEERELFDAEIRPRLGPGVEWAGEANEERKKELLAQARCLLFPIDWEEPFGLVMIEAMACGTPVVALRRGSVPEVVEDGVTGFVCDDPEELPSALERCGELDRGACRRRAEERFGVGQMVRGYERVYREAIERRRRLGTGSRPSPLATAG